MSGKKSSEVAAVLKDGEEIRIIIDNEFGSRINNDHRMVKDCDREVSEQINDCSSEIVLSKDAKEKFGTDAENLLAAGLDLQRNIKSLPSLLSDADRLKEKLKRIEADLRAADAEAEEIRNKIMKKPHFCDKEYIQAQALVKRYESCRSRQKSVLNEMSRLAKKSIERRNEARALASQIKEVRRSLNKMDEIAKKSIERGEQQTKLKAELSDISEERAKKFLADEYETLCSQTKELCESSDDTFLSGFSAVCGKIAAFARKLEEKYQTWARRKRDAEDFLSQVNELGKLSLFEPVDYCNNGEKAAKIGMCDYIEKYAGNDTYRKMIAEQLKDAERDIKEENFSSAMEKIKILEDTTKAAHETALELQESMLKKTKLAASMLNVMVDLHYDIKLEIINGNPNDGFRLTCSVGDEIIDFEQIDIDDDGKIIVNINHKEATPGNCQNSWKDITNAMRRNGVLITDVKKNGKSILEPAVADPGGKNPGNPVPTQG